MREWYRPTHGPFVAFETHNVDDHGNADVRLVLRNQGVGPARIQTLEMWYDKQE